MSQTGHILIIEDNESLAISLKELFEMEGYTVTIAGTALAGFTSAKAGQFDIIITDLQLPGVGPLDTKAGLDLIRQLHTDQPHLPIVLMTAHHTTEVAIEATKLGAYDYLLKPFDPGELLELIQKALASRRLASATVEVGTEDTVKDAIVGQSRAMQTIYKDIGRLAAKNVTVLIRGDTGTGKELVARALYQHSDRSTKPFIVVNCVAIPETLLESELFGHEQGAFTGATARRIGRFEQANGGTIFLDEIGDMTISTQSKLLRVLQEKTIQRLGGRETLTVDVRIITATHRDLEVAIREKHFREDLYYRLNVAVIHLPALRDRREDIPALVRYFLQRYGRELGVTQPAMAEAAIQYLQQQPWHGNVRELENVVRKSLLHARGLTIGPAEVTHAYTQSRPPQPGESQPLASYVADLLQRAVRGELEKVHAELFEACERELFAQAFKLADGNQAKAAKWLGVSRPTIREKLIQFGLYHPRDANTPETGA
ncbi:MAG: sigma-54 dependent transcriptional regulator [Verrucomicrobiota bacterium]